MTTAATPLRKDHTCNGATTLFLYDWKIDDATELVVTQIDNSVSPVTETTLTYPDNYAVTGVGDDEGGNVQITPALSDDYEIVITSGIPYQQDADFTNQNSVKPEEVEGQLDKLCRQIKRLVVEIERCIKIGLSDDPNTADAATYLATILGYANTAQAGAATATTKASDASGFADTASDKRDEAVQAAQDAQDAADEAASIVLGNLIGLSLLGRAGNTTGAMAAITAASDHQVLRRSGAALAFGAVNLASADAVTGELPSTNVESTVNIIGSIGGGTQDIDLSLGRAVSATVDTSTTTFTFSNPKATGKEDIFTLRLTNGGSQTVNWPASVDWIDGTAPTLTASGVDELIFKTINGGTLWVGTALLDVK